MAFLDWLLGLGGGLSASDGSVALATPLPAWAWVAVVAAAVALGVLAYRRMPGGLGWRVVAAAARTVALVAVVWLLCGPQWVERRERVEPDVVAVLVDRSASLLTEDADAPAGLGLAGEAAAAGAGERRSRDAALRERLAVDGGALAGLANERRRVRWLGFGGGSFPLEVDADGRPDLGPAGREATGLVPAVLDAATDPGGAPVAAVVVFSDGRSPEPLGAAAEARLAAAGVPVIAVPLGPDGAAPDPGLGPVAAPPRAFRGDRVPVSVELQGVEELPAGTRLAVRLVEPGSEGAGGGRTLDEKVVTPADLAAAGGRVRLRGQAGDAGRRDWEVRLVAVDGERNEGNNTQALSVEVLDRPLAVLYAEGPPRWEYRYLKNLLLREASVGVSVVLFSADAGFVPEGDRPIERFPVTAEELAGYDVIVVGDVEPGYLSEDQEKLIVERVSEGGAGLLFVGGPRRMPSAWAGRPLAELLPVAEPAAVTAAAGESFAVRTTPLAGSLAVLDLMEEQGDSEAGGGVLPLPAIRYAQRLGALKPLAETLASWESEGEGSAGETGPLVVRMRAGAGQVLYTGTDNAWAWRRGVGERYPERYFLQMLRLLGRGAVSGGDGPAELVITDRRLVRGGTTSVELRLRSAAGDDSLAGEATTVAVRRLDEDGEPGDAEAELVLRAGGGDETAGGVRRLATLWTPALPGVYRLVPTDPTLARLGLDAEIEVTANADEHRDTATDHPKLAAIAAATGGRVVPLGGLAAFAAEASAGGSGGLPSVARITPDDRTAPLRTSPLALALVLLPLFAEWVIRRALRHA